MRWPVALLCGLGFLCGGPGCRNCDLVEAELRTREMELRELRGEFHRAEADNAALQREVHDLRHNHSAKVSTELASQLYTLKELVLARGTGGVDDDDCPGDEALQVALEPRDPDGHTIKAPGALQVAVLEVGPEGLKTPLSSWDVPPGQLRRAWRSGLFSTGYFVVLPWKTWPKCAKLRVVCRFTLADGRSFEADRDITVRLAAARPPAPARSPVTPSPAPVEPDVPLPSPRKVEPGSKPQPLDAGGPVEIKPAASWPSRPPVPPARPAELLRPVPLRPR